MSDPEFGFESLSQREREAVHMLADQGSPQVVAAIMGLSPKTVSTYLQRAKDKILLDSTIHLAIAYDRWCAEKGHRRPALPVGGIKPESLEDQRV